MSAEREFRMITEDFLEIVTEELEEGFLSDLNDSLRRMAPAGLKSEWDWVGPWDEVGTKSLPYTDQGSLDKMHNVGFRLYRDPNIQAAIETMVSFVVNKGWSYAVSGKRGQKATKGLVASLNDQVDAMVEEVDLGLRDGWYYVATESYRRYLRDGEFFRRWWVNDDKLSVRFVEAYDIRQPDSWIDILPESVLPRWMQDERGANREVPGELGIVSVPNDAVTPAGYWHRISVDDGRGPRDVFEFLSAARVQHCKCNVDENDPRGIPAFYDTLCMVAGITEVNQAMLELAVKQSKYAVVLKHKATNRREAIQSLRSNRVDELNTQMSTYGREPYETHLKNVDVEMGGMKTNTKNYIEVIQQAQRITGNVRQIPEFMITGDANTGNRSSLQSAESPFGRRVSRDQKDLWFFDRELMWAALSKMNSWGTSTTKQIRRKVQITPGFPLADTRDRHKDAQMIGDMIEKGVFSVQHGCRLLDVDFEQMQREREESPPPEPKPAAPQAGKPPSQE